MSPNPRNKFLDIFLFIFLGILWGGSFVAIKVLVNEIPPWYASSVRLIFAMATLLVIFKIQGKKIQIPKKDLVAVWIAGLFTIGFPFCFLFWGERKPLQASAVL